SRPHYFASILLLCLEDNVKCKLLDWFALRVTSRKRKIEQSHHEEVAVALQEYREHMALAKFKCSTKILYYKISTTNFIEIYNEITPPRITSPFKSLISLSLDSLREIKHMNPVTYKNILNETTVLPLDVFHGLKKKDFN
ncbi:hypothetical protein ENBRE01_0355, partial [Enteropsectra breve]